MNYIKDSYSFSRYQDSKDENFPKIINADLPLHDKAFLYAFMNMYSVIPELHFIIYNRADLVNIQFSSYKNSYNRMVLHYGNVDSNTNSIVQFDFHWDGWGYTMIIDCVYKVIMKDHVYTFMNIDEGTITTLYNRSDPSAILNVMDHLSSLMKGDSKFTIDDYGLPMVKNSIWEVYIMRQHFFNSEQLAIFVDCSVSKDDSRSWALRPWMYM